MAAAQEWARRLQQAQEGTDEAVRLEFSKEYGAAFTAYLKAGETYLWLVRNWHQRAASGGSDEELKTRVRRAANKVLERAELIKSLRKDVVAPVRDALEPDVQRAILDQGTRVGAHSFPLWDAPEAPSAQGPIFSDPDGQPPLASSHLERHAQFRRAADTAGHPALIRYEAPLRGRDIVQDVVTDCSFIAALQVAAEYDRRWNSEIATAALFPRDAQDRACQSKNGKYSVKLHFNGGPRRVIVDDMLPCFPNGTLIGAAAVKNDQFWPALVEKAFLKVMGGYDFPGSNSAADLHTLTGWLPEQVLLQQAGFRREQTWNALHAAFSCGRCILTVGTGATANSRPRDRSWQWLAPAHNYAVLDVREIDGHRQMTVVNSWRRAPGSRSSPAGLQSEGEADAALADATSAVSLEGSGGNAQQGDDVHQLSWEDICVHFDTIHVNWRLSDFAHSETVHCSWESRQEEFGGLSQNTQLQIVFDWNGSRRQHTDEDAELWLHLNRHMTGRPEPDAPLIAVHAFNHADGRKLYQLTDREQMGAFTDSSHALHKMRLRPGCSAVTVVVSQYGSNQQTPFSLSAYGPMPMTIRTLPRAYEFRETVSGSWSGRTAGGNLSQPTFGFNPQFVLDIQGSDKAPGVHASVLIMAETAKMVPLQVMLVHSGGGNRVEQVEESDVIMSSGMYTHAVAIAERKAEKGAQNAATYCRNGVPPGRYTLIVSTFAPGVEGDFLLTVEASHRVAPLRPVPQEGAGMFHRALRGRWSTENGTAAGGPTGGSYMRNPCWRLVAPTSGAVVQMRLHLDIIETTGSFRSAGRPGDDSTTASRTWTQSRPPLNLAIFGAEPTSSTTIEDRSARGTNGKVLIAPLSTPVSLKAREVTSSGPYSDSLHGVTIARQRLEPGEYVLVASTFTSGQEANFVIEIWSQSPLDVQSG